MICGFCGNKSTIGCIHCNPNGFQPGEFVEVPNVGKFKFKELPSQLDRIEAKLNSLAELLEAVFGAVEEYRDSGQPRFTEPAKESVNHERSTKGSE